MNQLFPTHAAKHCWLDASHDTFMASLKATSEVGCSFNHHANLQFSFVTMNSFDNWVDQQHHT